MAHIHNVLDTNLHFIIDPLTRKLRIDTEVEAESKMVVIQYDHNSERVTFEIPKKVDGHDMSLCNVVQVHYLNVSTDGRTTASGVYEVEDLTVSGDVVVGTWLISQNATQLAGTLNFLIRFVCTTDGNLDYVWNTAVYQSIAVSSGLYYGEEVVVEYADILEQWRRELIDSGGVTDDRIKTAVADYMEENPPEIESGGLNSTATAFLLTILRNGVYTTDQSANITALENALKDSGNSGGESGGEETPDTPDTPVTPDPVTYTVTNNLTNVSSNNSAGTVTENAIYAAILTASEGYTLDTVTVTMGGVDITSTAYNNGNITIPAVTGNVVITATAIENSTGGDTTTTNLFDGRYVVGALWSADAVTTTVTTCKTSDYLDCSGMSEIYLLRLENNVVKTYARMYFFYDENKTEITTQKADFQHPSNVVAVEVPSNAAYIRVTHGGAYAFKPTYIGANSSPDISEFVDWTTEIVEVA